MGDEEPYEGTDEEPSDGLLEPLPSTSDLARALSGYQEKKPTQGIRDAMASAIRATLPAAKIDAFDALILNTTRTKSIEEACKLYAHMIQGYFKRAGKSTHKPS